MKNDINGLRVAVLATDGFEEAELGREVVVDANRVTSRKPDDLSAPAAR